MRPQVTIVNQLVQSVQSSRCRQYSLGEQAVSTPPLFIRGVLSALPAHDGNTAQ
jgi:hypothetical protein